MKNLIDLDNAQIIKLPYLQNSEFKSSFDGKGWSFSFVFHFSELKNIYLAIKQIGFHNLQLFTRLCIKQLKVPYVSTPWDSEGRRILEQLNALVNFKLIDHQYRIINESVFANSKIAPEITDDEKKIFEGIYFSYFRFKEIMGWFIDPISADREFIINTINKEQMIENSKVIFPFSTKSRFTDSFIYDLKNNTTIYFIANNENESNGGILRFWDVFVKWGQELNLLEKFNLKNLDYQIMGDNKSLSCIYFKRNIDESFDLFQYIANNYKTKYINVPKLIFRIAIENRYSVEDIKNLLIKLSKRYSEKISLQRTSEIFIRNTEKYFVPIVNGSYISHILMQ